jgi:hypothetical protein
MSTAHDSAHFSMTMRGHVPNTVQPAEGSGWPSEFGQTTGGQGPSGHLDKAQTQVGVPNTVQPDGRPWVSLALQKANTDPNGKPQSSVAYGSEPNVGMEPQPYAALRVVLDDAYHQASAGKGKERHARENEAFTDQLIIEGAKRFGVGALLFQAYKKSEESQRLEYHRARAELLGAIVYLSAAVIALDLKQVPGK